jgi:hypothetical protein
MKSLYVEDLQHLIPVVVDYLDGDLAGRRAGEGAAYVCCSRRLLTRG